MPVVFDITRTGTFTRLPNNTAKLNTLPSRLNENPNLFGKLSNALDLTKGVESFRDEGAGDLFYSFFDYIKKTNKQGDSMKEVINADFVSNRHNFMKIAQIPYSWYRDEIRAIRKKGIIFLCNKKQENEQPYEGGGYGYKFEQYMTLKENEKPHDGDEKVSNAECTKAVFRTSLKSKGKEIQLFYAGEIDALDKHGKLVELKTTTLDEKSWLLKKSLEHYLQCFLGNVSYLVKGQNKNHSVQQVDKIETSSIPRMGVKWNPETCKDKMFEVLQHIKNELKNDNEALLIIIEKRKVSYHKESASNCNFIDQNFLNYFQ